MQTTHQTFRVMVAEAGQFCLKYIFGLLLVDVHLDDLFSIYWKISIMQLYRWILYRIYCQLSFLFWKKLTSECHINLDYIRLRWFYNKIMKSIHQNFNTYFNQLAHISLLGAFDQTWSMNQGKVKTTLLSTILYRHGYDILYQVGGLFSPVCHKLRNCIGQNCSEKTFSYLILDSWIKWSGLLNRGKDLVKPPVSTYKQVHGQINRVHPIIQQVLDDLEFLSHYINEV